MEKISGKNILRKICQVEKISKEKFCHVCLHAHSIISRFILSVGINDTTERAFQFWTHTCLLCTVDHRWCYLFGSGIIYRRHIMLCCYYARLNQKIFNICMVKTCIFQCFNRTLKTNMFRVFTIYRSQVASLGFNISHVQKRIY